ncbi:MAG: hypothetical protein ACXVD8_06020, partial [Actinomycetota bacterium]
MQARIEDLPAIIETPRGSIRGLDESGMTFTLIRVTEGGVDLSPLLAGLPGDMCPMPHWGYVIEGAIHNRFADGHEEVVRKGCVFYFEPGHIPTFEEGTTVIEIGP